MFHAMYIIKNSGAAPKKVVSEEASIELGAKRAKKMFQIFSVNCRKLYRHNNVGFIKEEI